MHVHLDVPEEVARQFGAEPGGITRVAIEALALEGVRSGTLTDGAIGSPAVGSVAARLARAVSR